jgi:hypothetical protein
MQVGVRANGWPVSQGDDPIRGKATAGRPNQFRIIPLQPVAASRSMLCREKQQEGYTNLS